MGSILTCFSMFTVGQCACCCGEAACGLWCRSCPNCRGSTSTRLMYAFMLLLAIMFCFILLSPNIDARLRETAPYCRNVTTGYGKAACDRQVSYLGIYRGCFSITIFFALFCILMVDVESTVDPRACLQNGFWFPKLIGLGALTTGAFYISADSAFDVVWMYLGLVCSFIFILIQLLFLVDFAHCWAEDWMQKYEDTGVRLYYCGVLVFTLINYALTLSGTVFMMIKYASGSGCGLHRFVVIFNLIVCILISGASIVPQVQDVQPRSGLLQSSFVSLYITFLTWSSVNSSPYQKCLPRGEGAFTSVVGILISSCVVVYSTLRNTTQSKVDRLTIGGESMAREGIKVGASTAEGGTAGGKEIRTNVYDDESSEVSYNWSFFHFMFALASLYVQMTMTRWSYPGASKDYPDTSALWVKVISSWLAAGLYFWTLVAPIMLPERDFNF